jgi:DNA-binding response OmpR family regulator
MREDNGGKTMMDKCAVLDATDRRTYASQVQTSKVLINLDERVVSVDDQPVHLTRKEYGILELLSRHKGTTLTKEMFLHTSTAECTSPTSRSSTCWSANYARNLLGRPVENITSRRYGVAAMFFGI